MVNFISLASSMYSLVLNSEPISVSIVSIMAKCCLFQRKPGFLGKLDRVESAISLDSLRVFVGAVAEISDGNIRDLSQLCDEFKFKFVELAKTVGDCPNVGAVRGKRDRVRPSDFCLFFMALNGLASEECSVDWCPRVKYHSYG
jgi:hypothetical protein